MDRTHIKRLLTICLALMLSVSMLPAGTFAAVAGDAAEQKQITADQPEQEDAGTEDDNQLSAEDPGNSVSNSDASNEAASEEIEDTADGKEVITPPQEDTDSDAVVTEEVPVKESDAAEGAEKKEALAFADYLTSDTGILYLPEGADDWTTADETVKLDPEQKIILHIAYEIPAGKVDETNAETEYALPEGLVLSEEEAEAANRDSSVYEGKDRKAADLRRSGQYEIRDGKVHISFSKDALSESEPMTGFFEIEVSASDLLSLGKDGENTYRIRWNDDSSIDTVVAFDAADEEQKDADTEEKEDVSEEKTDTEPEDESAEETNTKPGKTIALKLMAGLQNVKLAAENAEGRDGQGEYSGVEYRWAIDWATTADGTNFTYDEDVLSIHPADWSAKVKVYARLTVDVNAVKDGAEIPAETVKFTVPTHLFYGWNGEAADEFIAPEDMTSDPATSKVKFYYTIDGDTVTITNHKPLGGTDYFSTQVGWSVDPLDVNGGYPDDTKPHDNWWDNYINPYEKQMEGHFIFGNDTTDETLDLRMATRAVTTNSVSYLKNDSSTSSNHDYDRYLNWQDNWGEKPADADDYFYIFWEVGKTRQATTTQPFEFKAYCKEEENSFKIGDKTFTPQVVGVKKINDGGMGSNFLYYYNRTRLNGESEGAPTVNQISGKNYDTGRLASSSYTHLPYGDDDGNDYIPSGLDYGSRTGYLFGQSSADSTISSTPSTAARYTGTSFVFLLRYPWKALEAAEDAGINLAKDGLPVKATFHMQERWDSGYEVDEELEAAPTNIYLIKEAVGTIDKSRATYADIPGGQSGVLNDLVVSTDGWSMGYTGSSKTSGSKYLGQTIIIEDDNKMSLYPKGSSDQAESLTEDDYEFAGYRLQTINEYEGDYNHEIWSARQIREEDWTKYGHVYIYTRKRGETEYKPYEELEITGDKAYTRYSFTLDGDDNPVTGDEKGTGIYGSTYSTIDLPADTTGVRAVYHSGFYKTDIRVGLTARLRPTDHVKSIAQKHFDANKATIWNNTADFYIGPENPEHYGDASSNLGLTRTTPTLGLIKSAYTLPDDDARQQEAGKDKQQLAYVVLRATMDVRGAAELTAPYKMYKGTFYELLPKGVAVKDGSLCLVYDGTGWAYPTSAEKFAADEKLRGTAIPEEYYSYRTETDKATGQTMLIIDYSIPEDEIKLAVSSHMQAGFVLVNTIDNINAHGTLTANTVGFTLNTNASGVILQKGDSYGEQTDSFGERAASFKDIADNNTYPVFTQTNIEWNNPKTIEAGFNKDVIANNTKNGLPVDANFKKEDEVLVGNTYTYQLKFSTQSGSTAKNIIIYDVIETGTDDDSKQSDWTGFLNSIDLSAIQAKETDGGSATCAPVVYYSTTVNGANSLHGDYFDINDTSKWSTTAPSDLSEVTAIAIDCSKDSEGKDFVLGEEQMIRALVTMDTPAPYTPEIDEFALNGAVVKLTAGKSNGSSTSTETDNTVLISDAKVKLLPVDLELHKQSDPETGTEAAPTKVSGAGAGTIDYTLTVRNSGSYDYNNVVVEDEIPAGLTIKADEIKVGLNGAKAKPAADVSGVTVEVDGQKVKVTISQQHPTVLDDEGNVTKDKDTKIIIPTTVDALTKAGVKTYDNQGEITGFNNTKPETPIKSEITYHQSEAIDIPVEKIWDDDNNRDGIRPASVEITLMADGEATDKTLTLSESNSWKDSFKVLPKYKFTEEEGDDGITTLTHDEIEYTIEETKTNVTTGTDAEGTYSHKIEANNANDVTKGFKVTNTHTPVKTEIEGTKIWNDGENADGTRPDSIEIVVTGIASGVEVVKKTVTVIFEGTPRDGEVLATKDDEGNWNFKIEGLNKYEKGVEIAYTIAENAVKRYKSEREGDAAEGYTLTNTETTTVSVEKKWVGPKTKTNPSSVTVNLLKNGEKTDYSVVLSEDNSWKHTFGVDEVLPAYGEDGKAIEYTVEEEAVGGGYTTEITDPADAKASDGTYSYTVTNTYEAEGTLTLGGLKKLDVESGKLVEGQFKFSVTDNGEEIATGTNAADGSITFTPATVTYKYDKDNDDTGKHTIVISETKAEGRENGAATDAEDVTIEVNVTDAEDGTLTVSPDDITDQVEMTNSYEAKGDVTFSGKKSIEHGRKIEEGEVFTFTVTEDGETVATGESDADGNITFTKIDYVLNSETDDTGTHTYTVTEEAYDSKGVKSSTESYEVTVEVEDNGDGTLTATPSDNYDALDFTNTYEAEGEIAIEGQKLIENREFKDGDEWTFTIEGEDGAPLPVDANGEEIESVTIRPAEGNSTTFEPGTFKFDLGDLDNTAYTEKTFTYTITESGEIEGVVNDKDADRVVKIKVSDDGSGELTVELAEDSEEVTFTNTYTPDEPPVPDTEILISKVDEKGKAISGAVFEVYRVKDGSEVKLTRSDYRWLDSNGRFTVGTQPYLLSGLEDGRYEIREVKAPEGYRIKDEWPVTFTVRDGKIDASLNTLTSGAQYEKIGADSHQYTITNSSIPGKGVKTGDETNIGLWLALLIAAAGCFAGAIVYRRRREE